MSPLIEVSLSKILQTRTYTAIVLGNESKKFCIYMEPIVGQMAQEFFSNEIPERPQTYDFLDRIILGTDAKVLRVVLNHVSEAVYHTKILIEQKEEELTHLIEIDARPSDSLILALRHNAPIFCNSTVFDKAVEYDDEEPSS